MSGRAGYRSPEHQFGRLQSKKTTANTRKTHVGSLDILTFRMP
jgi:hypothetical protein